jgi:hypothetical protein
MTLALRAGWTWRQEEKGRPGIREYEFNPIAVSRLVPTWNTPVNARPDDPAAYSAFHLGLGFGMFGGRASLDGVLGFPGQLERQGTPANREAAGTEVGVTASYRVL